MQNRIKAQSSIVTIVAIIAVSILVVAVLFYSVKSFITPALSPTTCAEETLNPSLIISSVCLDSSKSQVQVTLERKITSLDISTIDMDFKSINTKGKWRCFAGCGECDVLAAGEKKFYYLNLDENPQSQSTIEVYSNGCKSTQIIETLSSC